MIFANQKSEMTYEEVVNFIEVFEAFKDKIILFPPLPYWFLYKVRGYSLGAQIVRGDEKPETGNVSAELINSIGGKFALVGHSEQKTKYEIELEKVKELLNYNIKPVLCFSDEDMDKLKYFINYDVILAYEPLWAIGSGKNASINEIDDMYDTVFKLYETNNKNMPNFLYGGSVNPSNIQGLKRSKVDGFLVGGASNDPNKLKNLL